MNKLAEFFKDKLNVLITIVAICIFVLSGIFLHDMFSNKSSVAFDQTETSDLATDSTTNETENIANTESDSTQSTGQSQPSSDSQAQSPVLTPLPITLEEAVSHAILGQNDKYLEGETEAEGHVILDQEEQNSIVTVYTIASFRWFGFENGIFTSIRGSGEIPTVMKFSKNQNGGYSLLEYQEPKDGSLYAESIKKMFPEKLWSKVLTTNNSYPELTKQMEEQAQLYLKHIGRNAEVKAANVEKTLVKINTEASNQIFASFTKNNVELNRFPYWIGTKEYLIDGTRYIYETTQSKTEDGSDLVAFKKTTEDGTLILEYKYIIVGKEPQLIGSLIYKNAQYNFSFLLPASWEGYSIITDKWEGLGLDGSKGEKVAETGPLLSIRHPKWTDKNQRQDIPIMIFTLDQWKQLQQDKFHIGAAPINPTELGRNSQYVFALPARYNFSFLEGYEEVEQIIQSKPLQCQ